MARKASFLTLHWTKHPKIWLKYSSAVSYLLNKIKVCYLILIWNINCGIYHSLDFKRSTQWANFLLGSGGSRLFGASVVATPIFPQFKKSIKIIISHQSMDNTLKNCIPIGQKNCWVILMAKKVCPFMEALVSWRPFWPVTWPDIKITKMAHFGEFWT